MSKSISGPSDEPRRSRFDSVISATRTGLVAVSTLSGRSPSSPSSTAGRDPWPWPVAPNEPKSWARTLVTRPGQSVVHQGGGEGGRRAHGTDRVRAGRPDPDLEHVERADGHAPSVLAR